MIVIDASGLVAGRLASFAAEKALKKERVVIVNAEKAVISGNKSAVVRRFKKRIDLRAKGNPEKGPKYPKRADMLLRRIIRGMLPFKKARGREAFKRVMVFIGVPAEFENEKIETIDSARFSEKEAFITVGELSKALGGK